MGCKIIFSPQAIADLESVVRFIAKDNPDAAVRVGRALIDRVAMLQATEEKPATQTINSLKLNQTLKGNP